MVAPERTPVILRERARGDLLELRLGMISLAAMWMKKPAVTARTRGREEKSWSPMV